MSARERITAPRIVQASPLRTVFWLALLAAAFLAVAWYAFDYGRTREGMADCGEGEWAERIAALERERDALKRRLAELEGGTDREGETPRSETAPDQAEPAVPEEAPEQERPPSPPREQAQEEAAVETAEAPPPDGKLKIGGARLEAGDAAGRFTYGFTVGHVNGASATVTGTIWIAVNGYVEGKPTRLSLRKVSPDRSTFVKMRFERQQLVEGELVLPDGFTPKNLFIEVKPSDQTYSGVAETVDWPEEG